MQLSFEFPGGAPLIEARARLLSRFGPQRGAGRHDPVSQLVKSLISSQTYDAVSAAAYARLKLRYGDWRALMQAPEAEVRALIKDVTYAEKKSPDLIAALTAVHAQEERLSLDFLAGLPVETALAWLERLHGVGRKIAAAVLNFSTLRRYAFVIDSHVLRVARRLGWISARTQTAEKAYAPLMALMPRAWDAEDLYELHWLMKRLGQTHCAFAAPDCRACPLRRLCAYAAPLEPPPAPSPRRESLSLKQQIARLERGAAGAAWGAVPFGDARIDRRLPLGGLQRGHWHEIGGDGLERETPAAAAGFTAALAARAARGGAIVWVLRRDDLYAPGLQAFGMGADRLILVRAEADAEALSVLEDAARTRGIAAMVGEIARIDLLAGRRLQLACEKNGATAFVLRREIFDARRAARGQAPAAATRWRIAPLPSASDEPGLGPPRWAARLERCRGGRTGEWIMEMQDATGDVRVVAELADHALAADHGRAGAAWPRHRGDGGERAAPGGG